MERRRGKMGFKLIPCGSAAVALLFLFFRRKTKKEKGEKMVATFTFIIIANVCFFYSRLVVVFIACGQKKVNHHALLYVLQNILWA